MPEHRIYRNSMPLGVQLHKEWRVQHGADFIECSSEQDAKSEAKIIRRMQELRNQDGPDPAR